MHDTSQAKKKNMTESTAPPPATSLQSKNQKFKTYASVLQNIDPDTSSTSWADTMETPAPPLPLSIPLKSTQEPVPMFEIANSEISYLIGVKGRNISLIRKYTEMLITIQNNIVHYVPMRKNTDVLLAWKMVLSACYGGILRWFETPYATKKGYPAERVTELQNLANSMNFSLDLLRSRKGHMCLMLVPNILFPSNSISLTPYQIEECKSSISSAREVFLKTLNIRKNASDGATPS
jgi:hypothetical protein